MHASIDQLLSLRDGEPVDLQVTRHMEGCTHCAAELARLKHVQQRLQSLVALEPPPAALDRIAARARLPVPRQRQVISAAAVTVVIAIGCGLAVRHLTGSSREIPSIAAAPQPAVTAESLDRLVAQSRELDAILQTLPGRPAVERVSMAATVDVIEQRIQWLDLQLSYAPDAELNDAQAYQLWRERVDLMDSLVKVRYAEGRHLSF